MAKTPITTGHEAFKGRHGRKRLIEALRAQALASGDASLARELLACGEILDCPPNTVLMHQGGPDNDLVLLISGEVGITVNGREIAVRGAGTYVGEMALVDSLAKRSATVTTKEHTIVLRIAEHNFSKLADTRPELWRRIAVEVSKRLRERNKVLRQPHAQPVVFIGSSAEGLKYASAVHKYLVTKPIVPKLWTDGVFQTTRTSIESLVALSHEADFAVLIFTKDDMTISRGKNRPSPRDNVVFELGLLMGALGRERVFILQPRNVDIKIPSDLLGVVSLLYARAGPRTLGERLRPACTRILKEVALLGPR
jgi:Predicted nucleotide-binding protein containing TIR -like domain